MGGGGIIIISRVKGKAITGVSEERKGASSYDVHIEGGRGGMEKLT